LREPQEAQSAAPPRSTSPLDNGILQRAQGTGMARNQPRVLITRLSQMMSCSARFCASKPAMM
jgi:hypothetical protein